MAADKPIPKTGGEVFDWLQRYPEAADELIGIVNRLYNLQFQLIRPGSNTAGVENVLVDSPQNLVLALPLKFAAPIANSTATAASVSTQLNLVLAQLRLTGQLPT
jgi:hypothetical protein